MRSRPRRPARFVGMLALAICSLGTCNFFAGQHDPLRDLEVAVELVGYPTAGACMRDINPEALRSKGPLGGLPVRMQVEVDRDVSVSAKTVERTSQSHGVA
jgi:hypothetical protein